MTELDDARLRGAARAVREATSVVALTGAGVSTASGIPDFRGDDGIWEQYDERDFHVRRLEADPGGFWEERVALNDEMLPEDVAPNAAHEALADLESAGHLEAVVTQNIDGLHQEAGSEEVVEVHGNGQRVVCRSCDRRYDADPVFERARAGDVPPRCDHCEGVLKPDTVLFGEQLPEYPLYRAQSLAEGADAYLAVGSSLTVEPAASFPRIAAENGATLVVVNLDRTALSGRADFDFRADVTEALPRLRDLVLDGA